MKEIDWTRVRRLVLSSGKPYIGTIDLVVDHLPDVVVHGFGKYGLFNHWYLIIESSMFPEYESHVLYTIDYSHLKSYYPKKRIRPAAFERTQPPDPFKPSG